VGSGASLNDASMDTTKTPIGADDGTQFENNHAIPTGTQQTLVIDVSRKNLTLARALFGSTTKAYPDKSDIYILCQ